MNSSKQIKWGALISYFAIFINIAAMLIYTPWIKNQIGISNYGLYILANSFINMFLMDFGIGSSVARFVTKYRAEDNVDAINRLVGLAYKIFLIIDLAILLLLTGLFFNIENIYTGLTSAEQEQFKALYVILSGFSIISFPFTILNGVFNAYEMFVPLKLCDLGQKLLNITCVVLALAFHMGVTAVVFSNAFSGLFFVAVKLIYLRNHTPIKPVFQAKNQALLKEILSFSVWMMVLGIAQRLTYNIAPSILARFSNSREIAFYSPASAIAGYFYTFAAAINGLFLPTVFRKVTEHKDEDILELMIRVGRFQVAVLGLLFAGFVTIGYDFLTLWMGAEFQPAYVCVILLTAPTIFEYSQQIANTTILAKNKVNYQGIGMLATSAVNLVLSSILSRYYGALGVSMGICATACLNLIWQNVVYYKVLKINVFVFYKKCYPTIFISILLTICVTFAINRILPQAPTWWLLIIKGLFAVIVYFLAILCIHLNKEERIAFAKKLKIQR